MADWSSVATAAVTALVGGGLIKYIESWLTRSKYKSEADKSFRDEMRTEADKLRTQIEDLKGELKSAEDDLDKYRIKYWLIYKTYQKFQLDVYAMLIKAGLDPTEIMPTNGFDIVEE